MLNVLLFIFFFSSRRRHTRLQGDWSSDVCSSDLVARRSVAVARALRMDEHAQTTVRLGAYLHDLGKVRVPHEILSKPGPLTRSEERRVGKECRSRWSPYH